MPGTEAAPWTSTSLVGVPAAVLAGTAFNARPLPLHVAGVRQSHADLFAALAQRPALHDAAAARKLFARYMDQQFALARPAAGTPAPPGPHHWRASYLKLLQGWGLDANGPAGAVIKGWAESRFGIPPVFHKAPLGRFPSPAWVGYLEDKGTSRYNNHHILEQLDLLYEFCQWMLRHFALLGPGPQALLWRGSNRVEEQLVAGTLQQRRCTLRLNSVVSFSTTPEEAGCFGDWLLCVQVPLCKLLLVPGLLDTHSLHGEAEVLAIGGLYEVQARYV